MAQDEDCFFQRGTFFRPLKLLIFAKTEVKQPILDEIGKVPKTPPPPPFKTGTKKKKKKKKKRYERAKFVLKNDLMNTYFNKNSISDILTLHRQSHRNGCNYSSNFISGFYYTTRFRL